jgi:hypothetical protein
MDSPARTYDARRLTVGLAVFFVLAVLALNGAMAYLLPSPLNETTLNHTWNTLRGQSGDDSWGAMIVALDHVRAKPNEPLYSEIFFKQHYRFQYPPSSLFVLQAMLTAGRDNVRLNDTPGGPWPTVNDILGWVAIAVTAAAVAMIAQMRLRPILTSDTPALQWTRIALAVAFSLTFYPIVKAYTLGQIQVLINALLAVAVLAWMKGRQHTSGVLVGLVALIKPHYGLVLLWSALRRNWGFTIASAAVIAIGLAAAVAVFGFANHLDYLRVISFLSQHGEAYFPNQSVNGVLNRLAGISAPDLYVIMDLPAGKFPPFNLLVYGATLVSSLALIGLGLYHGYTRTGRTNPVPLAFMLLCTTMAAPVAWEHHYGVTLPMFAIVLASSLGCARRTYLLIASYLLVATFFPVTNLLAQTWLNIAQSTLLIGAVILLWLLWASSAGDADYEAAGAERSRI